MNMDSTTRGSIESWISRSLYESSTLVSRLTSRQQALLWKSNTLACQYLFLHMIWWFICRWLASKLRTASADRGCWQLKTRSTQSKHQRIERLHLSLCHDEMREQFPSPNNVSTSQAPIETSRSMYHKIHLKIAHPVDQNQTKRHPTIRKPGNKNA